MKKFLNIFFVSLGVIFFIIIIIGAVFYVFDPLGLKETVFTGSIEKTTSTESAIDKNPQLSPTQEKALESVGIDPASLPTSITPAEEACFVDILGEARVAEIKSGSLPTVTEFFKAKSCLK